MAKRYIKKCTKCGKDNPIENEFCECGEDISMIQAEENHLEGEKKEDEFKMVKHYKKCRACGMVNYLQHGERLGYCKNCHDDSIDKCREEVENEKKEDYKIIQLIARNSDVSIKITSEKREILGRFGTISPECFQDYLHVAHMHCIIEYKNDKWIVTALEKENGTRIDGRKINENEYGELKDGCILSLANYHFDVKV